MKGIVQTIHMIGIGGAGMSGIAEVLLNLGYTVTGSDLAMGAAAQRLAGLGAQVHKGHEAGHVGHADVVVKSTAVPESNPEVVEARRQGIPVIPRAEMLAELMRLRSGIAVAGTHGKTTTTSLLAEIFGAAGQDPTVIIGGRLNAYGANARLGQGKYLIAEADESDGSFLILQPIMAIVTNIDADHLDHYPNLDAIDAAFVQFMNKVPFYGVNVVCGDDEGVRRVLPRIKRRCLTYGLEPDNRLRGEIVSCTGTCRFKVYRDGQFWAEVVLGKPGRHNVLNALAAIGIALEAGLDKTAILAGLENFGGVGRRFEVRGQTRDDKDGILVVDDYGHHPAEIRATLRTARECFPDRRLVVAFQPHRFTRTQALFGDFCTVFDNADLLLLTEIYPASEAPIPGVSGMSLAQGIKQVGKTDVRFYPTFAEMQAELPGILQPGDVFLTLGAGSIWQVGAEFLKSRQSGVEQGA